MLRTKIKGSHYEQANIQKNGCFYCLHCSRGLNCKCLIKLNIENEQSYQIGNEYNEDSSIAVNTDDDDLRIDLSGKYEITLSDNIFDKMYRENTVCVK